MKKSTLVTIGDIIHNLDNANKDLYDMIELLNLADDEMSKVVDSIFVLSDKIERIKQEVLIWQYLRVNNPRAERTRDSQTIRQRQLRL